MVGMIIALELWRSVHVE